MHRFYLPPEDCAGDHLELKGAEAHHARHVLRIRTGQAVTVLDGAGRELNCTVTQVSGESVGIQVERQQLHPEPIVRVTLLQAIPKGKTMDVVVQKARELGAYRIVPVVTERVVSEFNEHEGRRKVEKWRSVATESIKQCGSPWLPMIELPLTLESFLRRSESFDLPLIASLQGPSRVAREYFQEFEARHRRLPSSMAVWVGPEGDFTSAETAAIIAAGYLPITLGPLVLRADTAAIYCLSVLSYEVLTRTLNPPSSN